MKPLAYDLYCGLGGWAEGLLSEGWRVIGFDIEAHDYGSGGYPGELVIQDLLKVNGAEMVERYGVPDLIVSSSPCTEYSYMAMPWKRAKQIAAALSESTELGGVQAPKCLRGTRLQSQSDCESLDTRDKSPSSDAKFPEGYTGSRTIAELNALYDAQFRLQREISEVAGRYIPIVVENVRGAQRWVGPAKANFGSYYLWGDVGMVGKRVVAGVPRFGVSVAPSSKRMKFPAHCGPRMWRDREYVRLDDGNASAFHPEGKTHTDANKVPGISFSGFGSPDYKPQGFNTTAAQRYREGVKHGGDCFNDPTWAGKQGGKKQAGIGGVRTNGKGDGWFEKGAARHGSKSDSRKAASAQIAKIPFPLAQHIARVFKPEVREEIFA